jgi:hypothetical protein
MDFHPRQLLLVPKTLSMRTTSALQLAINIIFVIADVGLQATWLLPKAIHI